MTILINPRPEWHFKPDELDKRVIRLAVENIINQDYKNMYERLSILASRHQCRRSTVLRIVEDVYIEYLITF